MSDVILLVEDNAIDLRLTLRAFQRSNLENEVLIARDGAEALELLIGKPRTPPLNELPALVLLDLDLP